MHIYWLYSEQSKAYEMYNPIMKNTIISRDVVFKEQESWNGTVDKPINAQAPLMEEDDVAEREQKKPREQMPNKVIPEMTPIFSEQHGSSSKSTNQNSPSSQSGNESRNVRKR